MAIARDYDALANNLARSVGVRPSSGAGMPDAGDQGMDATTNVLVKRCDAGMVGELAAALNTRSGDTTTSARRLDAKSMHRTLRIPFVGAVGTVLILVLVLV